MHDCCLLLPEIIHTMYSASTDQNATTPLQVHTAVQPPIASLTLFSDCSLHSRTHVYSQGTGQYVHCPSDSSSMPGQVQTHTMSLKRLQWHPSSMNEELS